MVKRVLLIFILLSLLVLVLGCIAPNPPKPGKEVVKISVEPVYSLHIMSQKYNPLISYLARETGYDMRMVSAISYDNYLPTLESNQVDIGIQNPRAYITLVKTRGAYPLAKMIQPDGRVSYQGVIITLQGSGINRVEDLIGKEVVAASADAVGGFLGQALVCKQNGIDVNKDLHLYFVGSQDVVIHSVYQGKAAAGFVREDALPLFKDNIDLLKLKIIAYTDHVPSWCVTAFDNTPAEVANKIAKALLDLDFGNPEGRQILEAIGIIGFTSTTDSDYDIIREVMDELNIPY